MQLFSLISNFKVVRLIPESEGGDNDELIDPQQVEACAIGDEADFAKEKELAEELAKTRKLLESRKFTGKKEATKLNMQYWIWRCEQKT